MAKAVEINGQSVGRVRAGWILFKEAWRYLQSDKEMVFIPLIATLLNLFLFGLLLTAFFFLVLSGNLSISSETETSTWGEYVFYFLFYVAGAFTLAISQAGVAHTVYTRAHGGDATLGESLRAAFSHSAQLLLWSVITSTVGLVLRMIAERSKLLGRIVVALLGVAWSIMTYFVVPAIVLDKKSAPAAIGHSVGVLRRTWGEAAVSNISLGIVFFFVYLLVILSGVGLLILSFSVESGFLAIVMIGLLVLTLLAVGLVQSALEGVVKTLLYVYASEGVQPPNFNPVLLQKMLQRKDGTYPDAAPAGSPTAESAVDLSASTSFTPHSVEVKKLTNNVTFTVNSIDRLLQQCGVESSLVKFGRRAVCFLP